MDVRKYLNFCTDILSQSNDSVEKVKENNALIDKIRERAADPFLKVAVIGDFSAGKSTFINALIRQKLLKTKWVATTAIPTYIYPGKSKNDVIVKEQSGQMLQLCDSNDAVTFSKKYSMKLPHDLDEIISVVTTSNTLSEDISEVIVNVKTDDIADNLCIIDTPGVNPGDPKAKKHVLETQRVLQEQADATIILFSGLQVFAHSFESFLEENASRFMEDAVFVVTMFDQLEEDQRDTVIDHVRTILNQRFHISEPKIYGCAANYVTMDSLLPDGEYWVESFAQTKSAIMEYLAINRERIIHKQLSALLNELLVNTGQAIDSSIDEINRSLKILKENSVDNLESEIDCLIQKANDALTVIKNDYVDDEKDYAQISVDVKDSMCSGIDACTKIAGDDDCSIPTYCNKYLQWDFAAGQEKYQNKIIARINKVINEYERDIGNVYVKFNLALRNGESHAVSANNAVAVEMPKINYNGTSTAEAVGELAGLAVAVVPYLATSFLDGILGTKMSDTVDKAFGWFEQKYNQTVNAVTSEEKLKSKKESVKRDLSVKIDESFKENKQKILQEVEREIAAYGEHIAHIKNEYKNKYQTVYEKKSEEFTEKSRQLQERIQVKEAEKEILETYLCEIDDNPLQTNLVKTRISEVERAVVVLRGIAEKRF